MSVSLIKGRGWRFSFFLKRKRYTSTYFRTKAEAVKAEAMRRGEIENPKSLIKAPTGMGFLELVNKRLDHVEAYKSFSYYKDNKYMAKRWVRLWSGFYCDEISADMVQSHILKRARVSAYTANVDLRCLRAMFNFGIKHGWVSRNPTKGIEFLPVEKKLKYVPSKEDVLRVILAADPDMQDYLWTIKETLGRVSEINRMTWADVNFAERYVVLYTRKKKGGHLTPRKVPMTSKLYQVLSHRYKHRDRSKRWVFWHRYWSTTQKDCVEGPYKDRKRIMKTLCRKAGVRYFRYHALRHFGASVLDRANVGLGAIQRILGHENRSTTEIYLHSIGEAEHAAMAIYERECEKLHPKSHPDENAGSRHHPQPIDLIKAGDRN
ncbi:MAG: tyrosine-type recombinase/integrase [bacterium]